MSDQHGQARSDGDGEWVVHGGLEGGLDPEVWTEVSLPAPDGSLHRAVDANAQLSVGDGGVDLRVAPFSMADDVVQVFDNLKYLAITTDRFALSKAGTTSFACDLAVENVGGEPLDVRAGMAAFVVIDPDEKFLVFDVCGTAARVFAMHERLPLDGGLGFNHAVESPFADFADDFTAARECVISFDRSRGEVEWEVDGQRIYFLGGVELPEAVRMGFGMITMLPIRGGASQSVRGQGLQARWRRFRSRGVEARI